ncbi:MAG TPA: hypothetical protein VMY37_19575 [Thermoguttaceae bacterium]|nr:hypothetical protein [Thermoguttaceae bacterium]
MLWETDNRATETAREVFPDHAPRVLSNGKRQYVLQPTPFGRVELVGFDNGFVVAAERPPPGALIDRDLLPQRLLGHLQTHGLRAWKVVYSDDCTEAIRALVREEPDETASLGGASIPFVCPITSSSGLLGETRQGRCEQLAGLIASQQYPGPLAQLVGPDGVGKRVMAAAAARWMGWSLVGELPLSRLLVERVLQRPLETALDTVLAAGASLGEEDLLVVSDAELLAKLADPTCRSVVRELARLPHVVLVARPGAVRTDQLVTLSCPGLESVDDVRTLVAAEHPRVSFAGAALHLAMRAASVPGVGVLPGRLLYVVRLAMALRPRDLADEICTSDSASGKASARRTETREAVLAPDEISTAVTLACSAWTEQGEGE